jgi:hypothetical protein
MVDKVVEKLVGGLVLSFDGASDVNRRSVEVITARTQHGTFLVSAAIAVGQRKTVTWTVHVITKILTGKAEVADEAVLG